MNISNRLLATMLIAIAAVDAARFFIPRRPQPGRPATANLSQEDADDAISVAAFSSTARQASLANLKFIDFDSDASGNMWIYPNAEFSDESFRRSVENAAHGKTHIIRGGKVLIVDSAHRFWVLKKFQDQQLLCYDGHVWLPPHPASVFSDEHGAFVHTALQQANGRLVFAVTDSYGKDSGFHLLASDGNWTFRPIAPWDCIQIQHPRIIEMPGDRIAADADTLGGEKVFIHKIPDADTPTPPSRSKDIPLISATDGDRLLTYQPHDHPEAGQWVYTSTPLPDGSVLTCYATTSGPSTPEISWPFALNDRASKRLASTFESLADPDPQNVTAARVSILAFGPPALPVIDAYFKTQSPAAIPPQVRAELSDIRNRLAAAPAMDCPVDRALLGGRFRPGSDFTYVTARIDGQLRFHSSTCRDEEIKASFGPTYFTLSAAGQWSIHPLPTDPDDKDADWIRRHATQAKEDPLGNLWMGSAQQRILLPDFVLEPTAPPGEEAAGYAGVDRDGRAFFLWPHPFILNRATAETNPLPTQIVSADEIVSSPSGPTAIDAWLVDKHMLTRIDRGGALRPVALPPGTFAASCVPLRGQAVLAWLRSSSDQTDSSPWIYDGKTWAQAQFPQPNDGTMRAAIAALGNQIAPLVDRCWPTLSDPPQDLQQLLSDGGKGFWFQGFHEEVVPGPFFWLGTRYEALTRNRYDLCYYDGANWHDLWPTILPLDPTDPPPVSDHPSAPPADRAENWHVLGTVDAGKTLLAVHQDTGRVVAVRANQNPIDVRLLPTAMSAPAINVSALTTPAGRTFFVQYSDPACTCYEYRDGQLTQIGPPKIPGNAVLADADNRIWAVGHQTISVVDGATLASFKDPAADYLAHILPGPDNRLWLIDSVGVSQLRYDGHQITRSKRIRWNTPKTQLRPWIDNAGNLWLDSWGGVVARVTLPADASMWR